MEGGQTQRAQAPAASVRWLQFAQWLRQQRGGCAEEAVSEASTSDVEEDTLPADTAAHPSSTSNSIARGSISTARASGSAGGAAAAPVTPGQLARHTLLVPRLPDCRAEMRLTSDSCNRTRQEMTVMLAAPGMPLHRAPVLTAKQASALMSAICEPLLSLPVGRLTRKLSAPTKLQPTEDRGMLSVWLLPDDSLSLVWQSAQQLAPAALDNIVAAAATAAAAPSSATAGMTGGASLADGSTGAVCSSPGQLSGLQQSCSVAVWEELAHFPALAHLLEDAPVVTIHMLRGDASGRSFYIRVRNDVAEANLEAATAAVPDASRLLQQQREAAAAAASPGSSSAAAAAAAAEAEQAGAPRMYFWLTEGDLGKAVYSLGRLKSMLKRPPTLSKRSGVPERQLQQLGDWVHRADQVAAEHQQQQAAATARQVEMPPPPSEAGSSWGEQQQQQEQVATCQARSALSADAAAALSGSGQGNWPADAASSGGGTRGASSRPRGASHLPLLQPPGAGLLLGQHGMAAAAQMQGSMAALLPQPACASAAAHAGAGPQPGSSGAISGGGEGSEAEAGAVTCGSSTVSATAAALYQDHRFNVVCPCTVSVVVGMKVQAAGADPALLPAEASLRARAVAERQAKAAVDRSGRQRIEERLAEVVIRNIRAQRNRARQARQQQRDSVARQQQAERASARQATGRTAADSPRPASAAAAGQAWNGVQGAAAPLPCTHDAGTRTHQGAGTSGSPLAFRSSSGEVQVGSSRAGQGGHAFSSPASVPTPAALLPNGGRVTLGNLHPLLSPQGGLEASSSQGSPVGEVSAAAADSRKGNSASSSGRLSVADLTELLNKHKLE